MCPFPPGRALSLWLTPVTLSLGGGQGKGQHTPSTCQHCHPMGSTHLQV